MCTLKISAGHGTLHAIKFCSVFILFSAGMSGCSAGRQHTRITDSRHPYKPVPEQNEIYRIKAGDKLNIRNLNWITDLLPEPGATQGNSSPGLLVNVSSSGHIGLPDVGKIKAGGLTREQFSDTLKYLYKDILRNPIFEVEITNLKVKVLGAVFNQGLLPIDNEKESLGEVLAKAGGIKFAEAARSIQIIRGTGIERRVIEYDFDEIGDPEIINQQIYDDDLIYVPSARNVVRSAHYQRNITVIQPVLALLNFAVLVINLVQITR